MDYVNVNANAKARVNAKFERMDEMIKEIQKLRMENHDMLMQLQGNIKTSNEDLFKEMDGLREEAKAIAAVYRENYHLKRDNLSLYY